MDLALAAHCVTVDAGGTRLLQDVSAAVVPGELLVVLGANGAGKSTLLKVLAGAIAPSRGSVTIDAAPLGQTRLEEQARRRAVVSQDAGVAFAFSALDVVMLGRTPHFAAVSQRRHRAIARAALRQVGIAALADRNIATLSGGERQRVMLARALAQIWNRPAHGGRYLLLDEPTAALDISQQVRILELTRATARRGVGVLAVLHDINLAARYADRILLLAAGVAVAEGEPTDVLRSDVLESAYDCAVRIIRDPESGPPLVVPVARIDQCRNR